MINKKTIRYAPPRTEYKNLEEAIELLKTRNKLLKKNGNKFLERWVISLPLK